MVVFEQLTCSNAMPRTMTDENGIQRECDMVDVEKMWKPGRLGDWCDWLCDGFFYAIIHYKTKPSIAYRFSTIEERDSFIGEGT